MLYSRQSGGTRGLFTGFGITMLRDVPGSAIYYGAYEWAKMMLGGKDIGVAGALAALLFLFVSLLLCFFGWESVLMFSSICCGSFTVLFIRSLVRCMKARVDVVCIRLWQARCWLVALAVLRPGRFCSPLTWSRIAFRHTTRLHRVRAPGKWPSTFSFAFR